MVSLEAEHRLVACELQQLQNTSTTTSVAFNTLQSRVSSSVEALEAREEKTATRATVLFKEIRDPLYVSVASFLGGGTSS